MEQARLSDTRITHDAHYLAMSRLGTLESAFHFVELGLAADELDQSPPRRDFQPSSQRTPADDFVSDDWLARTLDITWAQRSEVKKTLHTTFESNRRRPPLRAWPTFAGAKRDWLGVQSADIRLSHHRSAHCALPPHRYLSRPVRTSAGGLSCAKSQSSAGFSPGVRARSKSPRWGWSSREIGASNRAKIPSPVDCTTRPSKRRITSTLSSKAGSTSLACEHLRDPAIRGGPSNPGCRRIAP
jgi:hypothetical protein